MQNRRKIAHTPIEEAPPKNSVHSKPVPPVALRAGHASSGVPASLRLAGVVAGKANISRRFVSSAFHQRNNPLRSDFVTRKSGTKPSYNSRQPALCLAKWPVAKSAFGQRDQAASKISSRSPRSAHAGREMAARERLPQGFGTPELLVRNNTTPRSATDDHDIVIELHR